MQLYSVDPVTAGLAARMLGPSVRIGRPLRVQGLPHQMTDPSFAASVGLSLFAAHPHVTVDPEAGQRHESAFVRGWVSLPAHGLTGE